MSKKANLGFIVIGAVAMFTLFLIIGINSIIEENSEPNLIMKNNGMSPAILTPNSFHNEINSQTEITEKAKAILDYALAQEQSESKGEYIEGTTDDGYPIAFYDVSGNDIVLKALPSLPSNLLYLQQDVEKHQEIWNVFTKLIPESTRNVNVFYLTTDGEDGIRGG
jgi:hypothetical protein